jgi:hypothetical protein
MQNALGVGLWIRERSQESPVRLAYVHGPLKDFTQISQIQVVTDQVGITQIIFNLRNLRSTISSSTPRGIIGAARG